MRRHALGARLADDAPDRGRMMLSNQFHTPGDDSQKPISRLKNLAPYRYVAVP